MEFYYVETPYVDYLRTVDLKVLQNKEVDHQRPYLGIVFTFNNIKYLIPLCSSRGRFLTNKQQYHKILDGADFIAVLKFNNMIPVKDSVIAKIDFNQVTDVPYKILLQKEYQFIKTNKTIIFEKAEKFIKHIWNSNAFYLSISNDFPLLENAMNKYSK